MVLTDNTEAYDHSIAPSGTGATTDSDSRAENVPPRQHLWVGPEGIKDERRAPFSNVSYLASQPRPAGFRVSEPKNGPAVKLWEMGTCLVHKAELFPSSP